MEGKERVTHTSHAASPSLRHIHTHTHTQFAVESHLCPGVYERQRQREDEWKRVAVRVWWGGRKCASQSFTPIIKTSVQKKHTSFPPFQWFLFFYSVLPPRHDLAVIMCEGQVFKWTHTGECSTAQKYIIVAIPQNFLTFSKMFTLTCTIPFVNEMKYKYKINIITLRCHRRML